MILLVPRFGNWLPNRAHQNDDADRRFDIECV